MKSKKFVFIGAALTVLVILCLILFFFPRKAPSAPPVGETETELSPEAEQETALDPDALPGFLRAQEGCGLSLPFSIPETDLVLEAVGQYSGPFVEDGSDQPTASALALVIRNAGEDFAEYGELILSRQDGGDAVFRLSGLPSGMSALVLESTGQPFSAEDTLAYETHLYARRTDVSLHEDTLKLTTGDGAVGVTNRSDTAFDTIYIRYKTLLVPQCYLGGITYSCRLEGIAAGGKGEAQTGHFSQTHSQIVMVEPIPDSTDD